jgi:hypothetical protein
MSAVEPFYESVPRLSPSNGQIDRALRLVDGLITNLEVHLGSGGYGGTWDSPHMQSLLTIIFWHSDHEVVNTQKAFIAASWAALWSRNLAYHPPAPEMRNFTRLLLHVLASQESSVNTTFNPQCAMHKSMFMAVKKFHSGYQTMPVEHVLRKIARAWAWYASGALGVPRSRLYSTYFPCLLHTWLTTQRDLFWPIALGILEEFTTEDHVSHPIMFSIPAFVFFVREEANELHSTSIDIRGYQRMEDVILRLLNLNHPLSMSMPTQYAQILHLLTLLSCLPTNSSPAVLKALWTWYEAVNVDRGLSAFSPIAIETVLKGAISLTDRSEVHYIHIGMVYLSFQCLSDVPH